MRHFWAALLLLCAGTADLAAQQVTTLSPGTRVRVVERTSQATDMRARRAATRTGTLQAIDSTSLTLLVDGQVLEVPMSIVSRVDVSRGNASAGRGALLGGRRGAGLGAASTGLLIGLIHIISWGDDCSGDECDATCEAVVCPAAETRKDPVGIRALHWLLAADKAEEIPVHMLRGAAVGGLLGVVAGSISREEWTSIRVYDSDVPVAITATGNSVGLTLRF